MKIYADLHCDTMTEMFQQKIPNFQSTLQISHEQTQNIDKLYQCFAIFFDDTTTFPGLQYLKDCINYFDPIIKQERNISPIYTIEGGSALQANLENIQTLREMNIRFFGFVWNGQNTLATGAYTDNTKGLSPIGLECLSLLISNEIIPDVSHLSEQGFYDIASRYNGTIVATHSNSRQICNDLRNLTDEQIQHIIKVGGLIGLNMHAPFLHKNSANINDIIRHAYHILQLGGEKALAMGCDFDGTKELPDGIHGAGDMEKVEAAFLQEFGQTVCENIMYKNALRIL